MGFVTGQASSADKEIAGTLVAVYIPTVPNPTSGNMAFVVEDDVMETDMSVEDAMKLVFSGGIVLPGESNRSAGPVARLPMALALGARADRGTRGDLLGRFEPDPR